MQHVGEVRVGAQVAETLRASGRRHGLVHGDRDQLPLAVVHVGGGVDGQPVRQGHVVQLTHAVDPRPEAQRADLVSERKQRRVSLNNNVNND